MFHGIRNPSAWVGVLLCGSAVAGAQTNLMVYPAKGQAPDQQNKDQYECNAWAVQQSGFDPNAPQQAQTTPQQRGGTLRGGARGAAAGAAIGAIAGDAGKGAAIGATAGAMKGGFQQKDRNHAAQSSSSQNTAGSDAYLRAMKACLQGRGYSVN